MRIHGPRPVTLHADRRRSSDRYRTFGGSRGSGRLVLVGRPAFWLRIATVGFQDVVVRPVADGRRTSGLGRSSGRCRFPRLELIWLVESPGVGRPEIVGCPEVIRRPMVVASCQLLLLLLALGVLAVLSMVSLLVPGHAQHICLR